MVYRAAPRYSVVLEGMAAGIWVTATIGLSAGAGYRIVATGGTVLLLFIITGTSTASRATDLPDSET